MENFNDIRISIDAEKTKRLMSKEICVISSGGVAFLELAGALSALQDSKILPNFKWLFGSSAGAICSLILVTGLNIRNLILSLIRETNLRGLVNVNWRTTISLIMKGYLEEEATEKIKMISLIIQKGFNKPDINFRELYERTGKYLVAIVSGRIKPGAVYLSYLTTPEMSVTDAINTSSNPLNVFQERYLFVPYRGKNLYADGYGYSSFPIIAVNRCSADNYFDFILQTRDDVSIPEQEPENVFGLRLLTTNNRLSIIKELSVQAKPRRDIAFPSLLLLTSFQITASQETLLTDEWLKTTVDIVTVADAAGELNEKQIFFNFNSGRTQMLYQIKKSDF